MHLPLVPLVPLGAERLSFGGLRSTVDAARDSGFAAVAATDHFLFQAPWLDGPTVLASVIERSGPLTLATTLSRAVPRGPVPLAKTLAALDTLSEGRLVAAVGPGSSKRDYDAVGSLRGAVAAARRGARRPACAARRRAVAEAGALRLQHDAGAVLRGARCWPALWRSAGGTRTPSRLRSCASRSASARWSTAWSCSRATRGRLPARLSVAARR